MFDDPKKELEQLEKQLIRAELPEEAENVDDFEELYDMLREKLSPEESDDIYYDDPDAPVLSDEDFYRDYAVRPPEKENLTGLVVTACLLSLGIVAVVLWWLVKLL